MGVPHWCVDCVWVCSPYESLIKKQIRCKRPVFCYESAFAGCEHDDTKMLHNKKTYYITISSVTKYLEYKMCLSLLYACLIPTTYGIMPTILGWWGMVL